MTEAPPRRGPRWPSCLIVVLLLSACGSSDDAPSPSGSIGPSADGHLQLRSVIQTVPRSSSDWVDTQLTCEGRGQLLGDCVGSVLDAPRIVLLGPGEPGEKYVLGPRIVDGNDVEGAVAKPGALGQGWAVFVDLTPEGTDAFATATEAAVGSQIAIIVDGRIRSSPTVAAPITGGNVVVASGLTEREATSLARRIDLG